MVGITSLNKLWDIVKDREAGCAAGHEVTKIQTWLQGMAGLAEGGLNRLLVGGVTS